ncbi:hypothetical protein Tco_1262979 [Tanacetum coccineum]
MGALSRPNNGCCGHFPLQRNSHDKAAACGGCWRALGCVSASSTFLLNPSPLSAESEQTCLNLSTSQALADICGDISLHVRPQSNTIYVMMESSATREPVADPDLLLDTHCWRGGDVEATGSRLQHRDGCALHKRGDHSHCLKGQAARASSRCWSDDKMSQMLTQLESLPEFGSGSGYGGCGDDEPSDDEDGGENEEHGEDTDN